MLATRTSSVAETQRLAAGLAALAEPGDLILLVGDLGSGKTAFAQGFARGLGVVGAVTSPTFTLHRRYEGRLTLHHLDVYRLSQLAEVDDLALPELLEGTSVTLIEWGDTIRPALPLDHLEVRLALDDVEDARRVELIVAGGSWSTRRPALSRLITGAVEAARC